jgi:hypothetical protein
VARTDGTHEERFYDVLAQPTRDALGRVDGVLTMSVDVTDQVLARRRVEAASAAGAESEARFRRPYESGVGGVFFFHVDGPITDANDAFLAMVGHGRESLERGELSWTALTPPGHEAADARVLDELRGTGRSTPFERSYVRQRPKKYPSGSASTAARSKRTC